MALKKTKIEKSFFYIGEVAEEIGETETVIKNWENEFKQVKPQRSRGGIRRYTKADIETLRSIKRLIRVRGLTIAGAREELSRRRTEVERREIALLRLRSALGKLQALEQALKR